MSSTEIYPTASTSLILIRNVLLPTVIYLRPLESPNFELTVRDVTGSSNILVSSVFISTIAGASFANGFNSYILNKPYGLVNIGLRNSTIWQVLHTSGQTPSDSAATVGIINVSTSFFMFRSTNEKVVSSLTTKNLLTENSIQLNAPFVITSLSTISDVFIQGQTNINGDIQIGNNFFISGETRFFSSVFVSSLSTFVNPVSISTSLYTGQNAFIKGTLSIGSTIHTQSTLEFQRLDATLSTFNPIVQTDKFLTSGLVSTLGSFYVGGRTNVLETTTLQKNSYMNGGILKTNTLNVNGTVYTDGITTVSDTLRVNSSVSVKGVVSIGGNVNTEKNISIDGDFSSHVFSSPSISSFQGISSFGPFTASNVFVGSNISTYYLEVGRFFSVGKNFDSHPAISTFSRNSIQGTTTVETNAYFSTLFIASSLATLQSLLVNQSVSTNSFSNGIDLTVQSSIFIQGTLSTSGSIGVRSNVVSYDSLIANGFMNISSYTGVRSYLLSNLEILTSSPFLSFSSKSIEASTVVNLFTNISNVNLYASSIYTSTLQTQNILTTKTEIEKLYTDSFFIGYTSSLSQDSKPEVVFDLATQFVEGISTPFLQTNRVRADLFQGSFLGDGSRLSNVNLVGVENLSSQILFASSFIGGKLFTSSIYTQEFYVENLTTVGSTVRTSTLILEGTKTFIRGDVNQILSYSTNCMLINNVLFFSKDTNCIGINTSTPIYDLDVSGLVYTSRLTYSTNVPFVMNTFTASLNQLYTSSIFVRDNLSYSNLNDIVSVDPIFRTGLNFVLKDIQTLATSNSLYQMRNKTNEYQAGIFTTPSNIYLNNQLSIKNNTYKSTVQKVTILNGIVSSLSNVDLPFNLEVFGSVQTNNIFLSSLCHTNPILTNRFIFPNLAIFNFANATSPHSTNQFTFSSSYLYMNNMLTVKRYQNISSPNQVGFLTKSPLADVDIRGSMFVSSSETYACQPKKLYIESKII